MHVKELSIQGFKSFATKHRFEFPGGITAIVGPNGSGKSNIADAVRWILGEHRSSSLRARRTDEMIFAGTERRPRAGLAEVSLTFDNRERWLDIDFGEVVITRRAGRDGTTSFAINGAPVRMREVQDLVGSRLGLGNYTVIGQGLVDSALTLRPEDRRVLIDEAAGLVPLQRKRDHSLRQLAETDENLTRVSDIVAELGPRLRRMARLASQAERYQELSAELASQLVTWYGYHWHRARRQLEAAEGAVLSARAEVDATGTAVESAEAALHAREAQVDQAEDALRHRRAARESLAQREAQARQAAAVAQARWDALEARRGEIAASTGSAAADLDRLRARVAERAQALATFEAMHAAAVAAGTRAGEALAAAESAREVQARTLEQVRTELFALASDQAARAKRIESIAAGRAARLAEHAKAEAAIATTQAEALDRVAERDRAVASRAEAHAAHAAVVAEITAAEAELAETGAALGAARDAFAEARAAREALRARSDALEAWFSEADESRETLTVLKAAGDVTVLGTVAQLIEVDEPWEAAVAAALGGAVHAVAVQGIADVERAIDHMRREPNGMLTLVALAADGFAAKPWTPASGEVDPAGLARSPRAPELVRAVLGDTVFVEDLRAALAALARPRGEGAPAFAATRDGLLVRRGGLVSGGTPAKAVLELERQRRALPAALEAALAAEAEAGTEVDRVVARRQELERRLADLFDRRKEAAAARDHAMAAEEQASARAERTAREQAWAAESLRRIEDALDGLAREHAALQAEIDTHAPREAALRAAAEAAQQDLQASDLSLLRTAAREAAADLAEASQALASARAGREAAEADLRNAEDRLARDEARAGSLDAQGTELTAEASAQLGHAEQLGAELATLDAQLGPAEAELRATRLDLRHQSAERDLARRRLAEIESRLAEARIEATRAEDRLERMLDQLRADAEWLPFAVPGRVDPPAAANINVVAVDALEDDFEVRLAGLRRQLRVIGPIDHETLAAYQETADRFAVLGAEQADLRAAEADLRALLQTLEVEMAQKFDATFAAVAGAFAAFFPQLFGGGEAELVLQREPEPGGQAGLDILARPPGKRRQPLALLSGGERALTAVALIFALLQVSRTPFVVLDEVDAALDEANVHRFCAALQTLAADRQVMIITHNRGTIQTASTIYGVTMGDDGASQIISLAVDAAIAKAG